MRIQHNIMAMNAYRNYTTNTSALSKNLEKLSSGYRINRAGDDAAGLAISEKMRAQITALGTASKNVKDGISLVKTAEGATQEVHDMLNRMVDLATQSANGTYQDKVDREAIEQEFNALKTEIDRIADASNFNGIKLLDGSMNGVGKTEFTGIDATPFEDGVFAAGTASKGEYTYDLSDLKINMSGGAAVAANATLATFTVGGKTLANIKINNALTAGDPAMTLTAGDFTITPAAASITLGGLQFNVTFSGGTLTMKGIGTAAGADPSATDVTNFDAVGLTGGLADNHTNLKDTNQGYDFEAHVVSAVAAAGERKLAGADFALTDGDIKDGTILKIGNETYSFKVGKDGKGGKADHEIDLTAFEEGDTGIAKKAIELLTQQDNANFHIITKGDGASFGLREKDNVLKNYDDWDLNGTGAAQDATWTYKTGDNKGQSLVQIGQAGEATGKSLTLQIGEDSEKYNQLTLDIQDLHSAALGLDKLTLGNQESAQAAVSKIKDAINVVSTVRSGLGATQNRLEHTANNLSVMKENIQDAESTIRDTDVAEEMMAYTKNNILVQSAQAMLAQANQVPQGVLQLLG